MTDNPTLLPERIYIDADYDPVEGQGHGGFFIKPFATGKSAEYVRAPVVAPEGDEDPSVGKFLVAISDGLRHAIRDHGPITKEWIGSAAKRVWSRIRNTRYDPFRAPTAPSPISSPVPPEQEDGWVTFGRVKVDIETETETFERIHPPAATPAPVVEQEEDETFTAKHFAFRPCFHSMVQPDCPSCCQSHAIRLEMQLGKLEHSTALPIRERIERAVREHMRHCFQVYKGVPPTVNDWIGGALHYVMWGIERDLPLTEPPAATSTTPVDGEQEADLLTVLKAGANFILRGPSHYTPEEREAVIKGLLWQIEVHEAAATPPEAGEQEPSL